MRSISALEVGQHNSAQDCWLVINGRVYNVTGFAPGHPGGAGLLLQYAGRDASEGFNAAHSPAILDESLNPSDCKGSLDEVSIPPEWKQRPADQKKEIVFLDQKPPLSSIINAFDFAEVAEKTMSKKAWAFSSSAATDLITKRWNREIYDHIWLRPRILKNVARTDLRRSILGHRCSMPVFVSPCSLNKMFHPDGEKLVARACQAKNIIQCISSGSSFAPWEIIEQAKGHPFIYQLYVNKDRVRSEALLKRVQELSVIAIMLTVDNPVVGKREADERLKSDENVVSATSGTGGGNDSKGGGLARALGSYIDPSLTWEDLAWLRSITDLPIIVKGITSAIDAKKALVYGAQAICLSNHGGRSLDTDPPPIITLLEVQKHCPEVFESMEVYVDGGIHRGTDIFKAISLGATAVGIGRPVLYAQNYGQAGIEHLFEILYDELDTTARQMGVTSLDWVHPGLINTAAIDHYVPEHLAMEHPYAMWSKQHRRLKAKL